MATPKSICPPRTCEFCGDPLTVAQKHRKRRFCSLSCAKRHMQRARGYRPMVPRKSVEERFWPKVEKTEGCWIWKGALFSNGYGSLMVVIDGVNRLRRAHRISYEMAKGDIPDDMVIMHSCDNRRCVNPDHLSVGTKGDNAADMARKGRACSGDKSTARRFPEKLARGMNSTSAKLTDDDVRAIRQRYAARTAKQAHMAQEYGVTQSVIWEVVHRLTWKHIE